MAAKDSGRASGVGGRKKWLIALLVIPALVLAVMIPIFEQLYEATKALHRFSDAVIAENYPQAYALTDQALKDTTTYESFLKTHQQLTQRMGRLNSLKITQSDVEEKADGWRGDIDATLLFEKGSLDFAFVLKKHQQWEVESYHEL
ncbi:MAG TPA: hypothetical protein VL346_11380 [Acidobacteriaceae bacterium]|nr:hypothetical protein [Acidobacteriaceae bacterium]